MTWLRDHKWRDCHPHDYGDIHDKGFDEINVQILTADITLKEWQSGEEQDDVVIMKLNSVVVDENAAM